MSDRERSLIKKKYKASRLYSVFILFIAMFIGLFSFLYLQKNEYSVHLISRVEGNNIGKTFERMNIAETSGHKITVDLESYCYMLEKRVKLSKEGYENYYNNIMRAWKNRRYILFSTLYDTENMNLYEDDVLKQTLYSDDQNNTFLFYNYFAPYPNRSTVEMLKRNSLPELRKFMTRKEFRKTIYLREWWKFDSKTEPCKKYQWWGPPIKQRNLYACDSDAKRLLLFCKQDRKTKLIRCGCNIRILFSTPEYPVVWGVSQEIDTRIIKQ